MPVIQVQLIEGRPKAMIETMIREVTGVISATLDAPIDSIRVIVTTVPSDYWGIGGVTAKSFGR